MTAVELTRDQARYLSVVLAVDIAGDEERGLSGIVRRHLPIWEALQPACAWDDEGDEDG